MNKIPWVAVNGLTAALAIAAVGAGTLYAGSTVSRNDLIGEEAAEEFALLDAGVAEDAAEDMYSKLERDDGIYVYDIEFYANGVKYEYEIRGEDGTVFTKEVDGQKAAEEAAATASQKTVKAGEKTTGADTTEEAEAGSGQKAGSQETDEQVKMTETEAPAQEAEAAEPEAPVRETKTESPETQAPETAAVQQEPAAGGSRSTGYISVDEAKQIALDHAGLTVGDVHFSKAKLENDDDDHDQYELEFYSGSLEYEYDINAITGEILEYDIDDD